jgi:hypothetical protein
VLACEYTNWHIGADLIGAAPGTKASVTEREEAEMALSRILLEKVRADTHPSATQMGILEETMPPQLVREYVNVLLEKVLTEKSPSVDMIRRIKRVSAAL